MEYELEQKTKGKVSHHRAVFILKKRDSEQTKNKKKSDDAWIGFFNLSEKGKEEFEKRMDKWAENGTIPKQWGHSWDKDEKKGKYTDCFCFKYKKGRVHHRLYGVYINDPGEPRYRIVLLCTYDKKTQNETDFSKLDKAHKTAELPEVLKCVSEFFKSRKNKVNSKKHQRR